MPQQLIQKNGAKVWGGEFRAFGELTAETGSWENRLRFPGQYYDQETGNYYNYFRAYDFSTGRYISSDPIGLEGGLNGYAYVGLNPLNWTDQYGLCPLGIDAGWHLGRPFVSKVKYGIYEQVLMKTRIVAKLHKISGSCECDGSLTCTYWVRIGSSQKARPWDKKARKPKGPWSDWSDPVFGQSRLLSLSYDCASDSLSAP
jgi:RHS repeat-associated protein